MSGLPTSACWQETNVATVIGNEALEGHEGIFLATHAPISGFGIGGSHAGEILSSDERAVLTAMSAPTRRHAFCIVQGEPGSGKSHLIRWLWVNWPEQNDIKLLLQRADGSLEGALRQLRARLPREFEPLFDNIGQRQRASPQGRARNFLSNLANALDPTHFDPPLADVEWCRAHRPDELVGHLNVARSWQGPARILRLLEGANHERNSATASFNVFDIQSLAACCHGIHGTGVLPSTERLANRLIAEADIIREYREQGWGSEEIEQDAKARLKFSIELMEALNRRRNDAIQNVLGVSVEALKALFRQVREQLAKRNQRLVLLLEDITSWEGIDDSLIDVLVTNAETRGPEGERDMCPLISVVGVTPAYYRKLPGNYRGRITHEINLGEIQGGSELQDVASIRSSDLRLAFAARYLSAVRTGIEELVSWREALRTDLRLSIPNRCTDCNFKIDCHKTFGNQHGIGLYPFTADALERMFKALNESDNGLTWKTPRGILQALLTPNLLQPDAIAEGNFPTILLENKALSTDSRSLSSRLDQILETRVDRDHHRASIKRLLAYWGNRERADTVADADGELSFAGVSRGIFEGLNLPWIGSDEPTALPLEPVPAPAPIVDPQEPTEVPEPAPSPNRRPAGTPLGKPPASKIGPPPSRAKRPKVAELERLRIQLRKWKKIGELDSPSEWNKMLFSLVSAVDIRRVELDPFTFRALLTEERVKIEGTGPAQRNYFSVKPERWVVDGFEAYIALRLDKEMTETDREFHCKNLATMMRNLEQLVANYADRRLTRLPNGHRWTPITAIVQILLVRAWLRGGIYPTDPLHRQLSVVLSDEDDPETNPVTRSKPWQDFLIKTSPWHDRFRQALRSMIALPQGEGSSFGLVDVSAVAGAIFRLRDTLEFDPVPTGYDDTGVQVFDKICELMGGAERNLRRISQIEFDQIRGRSNSLLTQLRQHSIPAHFDRIDRAVDAVSSSMPDAAPDRVKNWKTSRTSIRERLENERPANIQEILLSFLDNEEGPQLPGSALLEWLAKVPSADLFEFLTLAQLGEQVTEAVLAHVKDCVNEDTGAASLDDVHKVGTQLTIVRKILDDGAKP